MAEPLKDLEKGVGKSLLEKIKKNSGSWPSYTALGSFLLYVAGYLALRFHLTVLGIGTDMAVLDERYLFAGAKFLIYAVSSIPIVVLVVLVLGAVVYVPSKGLLLLLPTKATTWLKGRYAAWCIWWAKPNRLAWAGIICAVVLIQLVMRQCFLLNNILVAKQLPEPTWLMSLIIGDAGWKDLYFPALIAGTILTGVLWWGAKRFESSTNRSQLLIGLLAVLWGIQVLFLPVNFGMLLMDQTMPRVATPQSWPEAHQEQEIWLVWEGQEGITYLTRNKEAPNSRSLVTLKKDAVPYITIFCYDPIIPVVFKHATKSCLP